MKSRRVSIAVTSALLSVCQLAAAEQPAEQPASISSADPVSPGVETAPSLQKQIATRVKTSKALDLLDYYRPVADTEMRFLVVVDRITPEDSARVAPDLLASRDGRLWLLDQQKVRPLKAGDLARHQFSLDEARDGLKAAAKRPVSIVLPRRLVSRR